MAKYIGNTMGDEIKVLDSVKAQKNLGAKRTRKHKNEN
jgi:hypothetical protein